MEKSEVIMKRIAVVPWSAFCLRDRMFMVDDEKINFDYRMNPYYEMKLEFEKNGDIFHTVDMYDDLYSIDCFLFFELDWKWLEKITEAGLENRMIYCNAEPPVVNPLNSPEGYRYLLRFFPRIMTWNDQWVDNKVIFKRNVPYFFVDNRCSTNFQEKRLLTSISGNKRSKHPDELYSEREKVIDFFEKNFPEDFEFYGTGWEKEKYKCYCGRCEKKYEIYQQYKFAICFENMKNICGYVTEKILDCLTSGIVPIYAGASDVSKYVPNDCYIDYFQFANLQELRNFLNDMTEEEHQKYLASADNFLKSRKVEVFSGREYARDVYAVLDKEKRFVMTKRNKKYVWLKNRKNEIKGKIKKMLVGE